MELWTDKHKPETLDTVVGQGKAKKDLREFYSTWKPGQAAFLTGPPGVGKTLSVETLAMDNGLSILRLNASDSRSAKEIEAKLMSASQSRDLFGRGRIILIDEADGISGRERGAVGSITKVIKVSSFPVIIIANDPWKPKLAPLRRACKLIKFSKIMAPSIEKKLRDILKIEGVEAEESGLKSLSRFSNGDLRSAISDLQMVAHGRKKLKANDFSVLGFRERKTNIFSAMPVIFHSRRIAATRKAIFEMDKDPDEVFWWIESNVHQEMAQEKLAEAYDLLSRANIMRSRVHVQQNWRFKGFMTDLMSGISVVKGETHRPPGYRPFQQPTRIMMMGRTRFKRAMMNNLAQRIGEHTHSSKKAVIRDYLPYFRIMFEGQPQESQEGLELEKEDTDLISGRK